LRYFLPKGQLSFALMAILTFVGRLGLDVLRPVLGITYPIAGVRREEVFQKWRKALNNIQEGFGDKVITASLKNKDL